MIHKTASSILLLCALSLGLGACQPPAAPQAAAATPPPPAIPTDVEVAGEPTEESIPAAPADVEAAAQPAPATDSGEGPAYPIVDTGQGTCYDANGSAAACPTEGEALFGQDAQYAGHAPRYTDNGDGTISDQVTGLMWQQDPGAKMTFDEAVAGAETFSLGGYDDWRLPGIKELYSLILFYGIDPSGLEGSDTSGLVPFIDADYFAFEYGDPGAGERIIDAQFASSTVYVGEGMDAHMVFGVNFADGRIKGYGSGPLPGQSGGKTFFVLYVRGNPSYGVNDFVDNGDGTITDRATGLTWAQGDSGSGMVWGDALAYCEGLTLAGHDDWRLPNAKELQSIVDYSRSPDTTGSAALDPLFDASPITDEAGAPDYPFYWSSTTHANHMNGLNAAYVAFGRALGYMRNAWIDVHGAGAQRSDPKTGDPAAFPQGHGPQGDAIRIYNYARCVRGGDVTLNVGGDPGSEPPGAAVEAPPTGEAPPQPGEGGQPSDLAAAAAELGVSEQALREALGPSPPDLAAAAQKLGVTVEELADALGVPPPPDNAR
jgi:hypothetical protein